MAVSYTHGQWQGALSQIVIRQKWLVGGHPWGEGGVMRLRLNNGYTGTLLSLVSGGILPVFLDVAAALRHLQPHPRLVTSMA